MPNDLQHARKRIDEIDRRLLEVLAQRQDLIDEIAALKSDADQPVRDADREQDMMERLQRWAEEAGLSPSLVTTLFDHILDHSVRRQHRLRREDAAQQSAGDEKAPTHELPSRESEEAEEETDRPYQLAARTHAAHTTRIRVGDAIVGGEAPVLIAGPCSVESRQQTLSCAEAVQKAGGHILRGGCFKPRTSPYSFQGLGYEGLDILKEAGSRHDLPIITEALRPADVRAVARQADVLQIGARNMQNYPLLKEAGRVDTPVMLKRGLTATLDEWLAAAEYILSHGNEQVMLCERGVRTFGESTRFTMDVSAVPVLRERTHLPIIVDPSHACGNRRWVPALAKAALAAGADGIMVETHPAPDEALSDGPQSLTFERLHQLAAPFRRAPAEAA